LLGKSNVAEILWLFGVVVLHNVAIVYLTKLGEELLELFVAAQDSWDVFDKHPARVELSEVGL